VSSAGDSDLKIDLWFALRMRSLRMRSVAVPSAFADCRARDRDRGRKNTRGSIKAAFQQKASQ
jgi:hypothetical protein